MTRGVTLNLSREAASVRVARQFIRSSLVEWGCVHLVETAMLLTSEAVTNAIVHAITSTTARQDIGLAVSLANGRVRVEIADGDDQMRLSDPDPRHGRGQLLLDALATSWGTTPDRGGKIVWFELAS